MSGREIHKKDSEESSEMEIDLGVTSTEVVDGPWEWTRLPTVEVSTVFHLPTTKGRIGLKRL